jgi:ABC-2 type transport system ATP-binding protein
MDEAGRCDRLLLLREGRLLADSSPAELRSESGTDDLEEAFLRLIRAREEVGVSGQGREHRSEERARSGAPRGSEPVSRA